MILNQSWTCFFLSSSSTWVRHARHEPPPALRTWSFASLPERPPPGALGSWRKAKRPKQIQRLAKTVEYCLWWVWDLLELSCLIKTWCLNVFFDQLCSCVDASTSEASVSGAEIYIHTTITHTHNLEVWKECNFQIPLFCCSPFFVPPSSPPVEPSKCHHNRPLVEGSNISLARPCPWSPWDHSASIQEALC